MSGKKNERITVVKVEAKNFHRLEVAQVAVEQVLPQVGTGHSGLGHGVTVIIIGI